MLVDSGSVGGSAAAADGRVCLPLQVLNSMQMFITESCVFLQEVGNRYGQFSLATMFPRREFTTEDLEKSLLELELAPSASIVLLPVSDTHTHA